MPMAWYDLEAELGIKPKRKTKEEIESFINNEFLHGRFTNGELEIKLSEFVGKRVHFEECTDTSDNLFDYMLTCEVYEALNEGKYLDVNLWYLKTRYGAMYITEGNVDEY